MKTPVTDIWQFEMTLSRRLLKWAGASIVVGGVLLCNRTPLSHGLGGQFAGWGAIDGLLALFGRYRAGRQAAKVEVHTPQYQERERRNMRHLLFVNTGLDVLYVSSGLVIVKKKGQQDDFWHGTGWGIVVQGVFLFFFDLFHALELRD